MKIILWSVELKAAIYRNIMRKVLFLKHICIICKVVLVDLLDCYTDRLTQHKFSDTLKDFTAAKHYWEKISAIYFLKVHKLIRGANTVGNT